MSNRAQRAFAICATMLLAACTSAPTRNYVIRGSERFYDAAQTSSAKEWMLKRGIHDHVSYGPDTISFKFGSEDIRTMDYAAFESFMNSRIAGQTIASLQRADVRSSEGGVPYAIVYFDKDGRFAQWSGNALRHGRWWLEGVPQIKQAKMRRLGVEPPQRVICYQQEATIGKDTWSVGLPACSPAYEQLTGIHGKQVGDVFNLMSDKAPGTLSPRFSEYMA